MPRPKRPVGVLTARQQEIRDLRSQGLSPCQIAASLGITRKTVNNTLWQVGSVRPKNRYRIQKHYDTWEGFCTGWLVIDSLTQVEHGPFPRNRAIWLAYKWNKTHPL